VASGVSDSGGILLAFPVVNKIAPFTIDTRSRELIFHFSESGQHRLSVLRSALDVFGARLLRSRTTTAGIEDVHSEGRSNRPEIARACEPAAEGARFEAGGPGECQHRIERGSGEADLRVGGRNASFRARNVGPPLEQL